MPAEKVRVIWGTETKLLLLGILQPSCWKPTRLYDFSNRCAHRHLKRLKFYKELPLFERQEPLFPLASALFWETGCTSNCPNQLKNKIVQK